MFIRHTNNTANVDFCHNCLLIQVSAAALQIYEPNIRKKAIDFLKIIMIALCLTGCAAFLSEQLP